MIEALKQSLIQEIQKEMPSVIPNIFENLQAEDKKDIRKVVKDSKVERDAFFEQLTHP